jgi:hypothetical protein
VLELNQRDWSNGRCKINESSNESKYARTSASGVISYGIAEATRADPHVQIDNYVPKRADPRLETREPQHSEIYAEVCARPGDLSRTVITNIYLNAAEYEVLSV